MPCHPGASGGIWLVTLFPISVPVYNSRTLMQRKIQITGVVWTLVYPSIIVWIYATEPRSFREVATNSQVAVGTYEIGQGRLYVTALLLIAPVLTQLAGSAANKLAGKEVAFIRVRGVG